MNSLFKKFYTTRYNENSSTIFYQRIMELIKEKEREAAKLKIAVIRRMRTTMLAKSKVVAHNILK